MAHETSALTLEQRIASEPDNFVTFESYDDFHFWMLEKDVYSEFDAESLMRVRLTGVLGYYKGLTIVVLPVTEEPKVLIESSDIPTGTSFSISAVGRVDDNTVLELEGAPTVTFAQETGVTGVIAATRVTIPETATDVRINGILVTIIRSDDRTQVQIGNLDAEDHIFSSSKLDWATTMQILSDLKTGPDYIARAPRQTGKTTALCLRALEFASEGLRVNIIAPVNSMRASIATVCTTVAEELYPDNQSLYLSRIRISSMKAYSNMDRYLVDEPQLLVDETRAALPPVHGQVISTD
jgi:hypothetical protein